MKIIQSLTPADFNREFDSTLFEEWKVAYQKAATQGMYNMIWVFCSSIVIYLFGVIGILLFFVGCIFLIVQIVKKNKTVNELNAKLNINKQEIGEALKVAKRRLKALDK